MHYRLGYAFSTSRARVRSIDTVTTEVVDSAFDAGMLGVGEGARLCGISNISVPGEVTLGSVEMEELHGGV